MSFLVDGRTPKTDLIFTSPRGALISKLLMVIGPNGGGKTNVLKPLAFIQWFIVHSFTSIKPGDGIPVESHFFSESNESEFSIEFEDAGKQYRYDLIVNHTRVVHEALYLKADKTSKYVFHRNWSELDATYKIRQQNFHFLKHEANRVRQNASLISTAAQYNVPIALKLVDYFSKFSTNVYFIGRENYETSRLMYAADFFIEHPEFKSNMTDFMTNLDLGLSEFAIESQKSMNKESGKQEILNVPIGIHRNGNKVVSLPLWRESHGTQSAFVLLEKISPALERGGLVVIDELELGLHPDMVFSFLEQFIDPNTNPHNAQIIFTTHAIEILMELQKEQIVLVEKNSNGVSEAWHLTDIKGIRRDDNLYTKFRAGTYGAIPNI